MNITYEVSLHLNSNQPHNYFIISACPLSLVTLTILLDGFHQDKKVAIHL